MTICWGDDEDEGKPPISVVLFSLCCQHRAPAPQPQCILLQLDSCLFSYIGEESVEPEWQCIHLYRVPDGGWISKLLLFYSLRELLIIRGKFMWSRYFPRKRENLRLSNLDSLYLLAPFRFSRYFLSFPFHPQHPAFQFSRLLFCQQCKRSTYRPLENRAQSFRCNASAGTETHLGTNGCSRYLRS